MLEVGEVPEAGKTPEVGDVLAVGDMLEAGEALEVENALDAGYTLEAEDTLEGTEELIGRAGGVAGSSKTAGAVTSGLPEVGIAGVDGSRRDRWASPGAWFSGLNGSFGLVSSTAKSSVKMQVSSPLRPSKHSADHSPIESMSRSSFRARPHSAASRLASFIVHSIMASASSWPWRWSMTSRGWTCWYRWREII